MSENTFPFAGDEAPYDDAPAEGNRSRVLVFGALAAAVVLGGGYLLFGGGDSAELTAASDVVRPSRAVKAAETAKRPVLATLPIKYDEQIGRDPFRALYVRPAPAAVAAPAAPGSTGVLVPIFGGSGTTGGAAGPAAPAGSPTAQTYKLVLTRVYGTAADRTAVFSIDGKQQVAKIGTKFGPTSEIILLSFQEGPKPGQWTTVLQVGDGDPFDVVTGVPAYVR